MWSYRLEALGHGSRPFPALDLGFSALYYDRLFRHLGADGPATYYGIVPISPIGRLFDVRIQEGRIERHDSA